VHESDLNWALCRLVRPGFEMRALSEQPSSMAVVSFGFKSYSELGDGGDQLGFGFVQLSNAGVRQGSGNLYRFQSNQSCTSCVTTGKASIQMLPGVKRDLR
jgi:hypothetical protein